METNILKSVRLRNRLGMLLIGASFMLPGTAPAAMEFLSIGDNAVIMYNAPSLRADKLFVASRYLPVEVVVNVEDWVKVRDSGGSLVWVEKKSLSTQRYVIVTVPLADIYQSADINAPRLFQAEENLVMEWLDSDVIGWVKVRHRDGQVGYVKVSQVWGS